MDNTIDSNRLSSHVIKIEKKRKKWKKRELFIFLSKFKKTKKSGITKYRKDKEKEKSHLDIFDGGSFVFRNISNNGIHKADLLHR